LIRSEAALNAEFAEPAFALFRDPLGLHQSIFARLSPFGLRLTDIKAERGDGSLGDGSFNYSLLSLFISIRLRFDRIEFLCSDLSRVSRAQAASVAVGVLDTVQTRPGNTAYRAFTLALGFHGVPVGVTPKDFVEQFSKGGPVLRGGPLGSGTVFYYGAEAEQVTATATIDLSALSTDAIYFRCNAVWDATKVSPRDLQGMGEKFFNETTGAFGLEIVAGDAS
jgi:hypothetical protein